jgi:hypothetical protein
MRLAAMVLAGGLAATVGADVTAQPRMEATPRGTSQGVSPVREAETSMERKPAGEASRLEKGTLGRKAGAAQESPIVRKAGAAQESPIVRKAGAAQESPIVRKAGPSTGISRSGGANAAAVQPGMGFFAECGSGFAKAIKPNHPGGFYECRLPAYPACTAGYEHRTANPSENRFQYACLDDMAEFVNDWAGEGKPQVCPQGWALSDPGGDYSCSSSLFSCRSDHEFDGVGVDALDAWPHQQVVYSYRCSAK